MPEGSMQVPGDLPDGTQGAIRRISLASMCENLTTHDLFNELHDRLTKEWQTSSAEKRLSMQAVCEGVNLLHHEYAEIEIP